MIKLKCYFTKDEILISNQDNYLTSTIQYRNEDNEEHKVSEVNQKLFFQTINLKNEKNLDLLLIVKVKQTRSFKKRYESKKKLDKRCFFL